MTKMQRHCRQLLVNFSQVLERLGRWPVSKIAIRYGLLASGRSCGARWRKFQSVNALRAFEQTTTKLNFLWHKTV